MSEKRKSVLVNDVLRNVFQDRNWQYRLQVNRVFLFWDEVVGEEIASYAQPDVFKRDVLWVKVTDSIRIHQLHFKKIDLLEKINQRLRVDCGAGKTSVKLPEIYDIKFRVAREIVKKKKIAPEPIMGATVNPQREQP